jgi:hypothetical protein
MGTAALRPPPADPATGTARALPAKAIATAGPPLYTITLRTDKTITTLAGVGGGNSTFSIA